MNEAAIRDHAPQGTALDASRPRSLGAELKDKEGNFTAALPAHMPVERFMRVVLTAIQNNPELARADRPSLWNAAMRAAQDGLLPDGREGALVIYNAKEGKTPDGKDRWIKKVQWMPMIAGIRKKVRNSGEIKDWNAQVVHAKDEFEFELGDDPFIKHKPYMGEGDPGPVIAAYSIAQFNTGEKSREVMTRGQIEKVRSASKSKDSGPWIGWYEEMCRKTVARRHSKTLPMSTDLDDLMRRDDDLYDIKGAREEAVALAGGRPQTLAGKLDLLAAGPEIAHDPDTGEIVPDKQIHEPAGGPAAEAAGPGASGPQPKDGEASAPASPSKASPAGETSAERPPSMEREPPAKTAANAKREAILADLTQTGDRAAAKGSEALTEFLDGLTGDEQALLSHTTVKTWRETAAKASQGASA